MQDYRNHSFAPQPFQLTVPLAGPLRMEVALSRRSAWSLTSRFGDESAPRIQLTEDTDSSLRLGFTITANSQRAAEQAGDELAQQTCDLLSVRTDVPIRPWPHDDDPVVHTTAVRQLTVEEWDWVSASLVRLKLTQPTFLAAAGWFRKALLTEDPMEAFCCCFQVIERISLGYGSAHRSDSEHHPDEPAALLAELTSDLCRETLRNVKTWRTGLLNAGSPPRDLVAGIRQLLPEIRAAAHQLLTAVRCCCLEEACTSFTQPAENPAGNEDQNW